MKLQIRNNKLTVCLNRKDETLREQNMLPQGDERGVIPAEAGIHKGNKKRSGFLIDTFGNDKVNAIPSDCGNPECQQERKCFL